MNSSSSAISSAMPDSAPLVIKVSYGDTVRRFSVPKNAAQYLGMDDLRAKILDFFKFVHDADLIVSYIDEDQDVVTLVDDEDLRDAIRQRINPLRIKVSLNSKTAGSLDSGSSGTSAPVRSPHADSHPLSRSSGVSELLKSVPEPLREAVMKVSHDLASKAASSAPVVSVPEPLREVISKVSQDLTLKTATSSPLLAELLESFLKMAISGGGSVAQSSLNDHNGSKTSDRSVLAEDVYGNVKSEGVATSVSQTTVPQATAVGFDLNEGSSNSEPSAVNQSSTQLLTSISEKGKTVQKEYDSHSKNVPAYNPTLPYFPTPNAFSPSLPSYAPAQPGYSPTAPSYNGGYVFPVDNREKLPSGASFGSSLQNTTSVNGQKDQGLFRSFNSSMSFHDNNMGRIFHKGVRCDGCGVHPITGPRFKSKVKIDYDLCSVCFAEMGNENDYTRIDWPRSYRSARAFKDLQVPHLPRFRNSFMPHLRRCPMRPREPKLDSHFIQDVNIADGTQMAPRTPFTKIWRMRNNGSITWPRGTRLVWIGGDLLTNAQSVELEMPAEGCLMENVLDIAVHFTAPELPGQYVSYWRMALPSGQKFGQCVWVIIQVDLDATQDASSERLCNLNLNLPPKSSEAEGSKNSHHLIDMNAEPIDLNHSGFGSDSVMTVEIVKPIVDLPHPSKDAEIDATVNVGAAPEVPATVPCPAVNSFAPNKESALSYPLIAVNSSAPNMESAVSYPLIAVNSSEPYKESAVSYPLIDLTASTDNVDAVPISESLVAIGSPVNVPMFFEDLNNDNMVEQTLLKELEEMGFQEIDLNKEILRRNNYNFEQSVDELCGVSEWDPMLEDLDEMGFSDKETNKKLLIKNGGSIKRVVMDLIAGEKA